MLDTNVFLDFLLIQWKEDGRQKLTDLLKRSKTLKEKYLEKKFVNYATPWNLLEFRDVVEKIVEEKKLIEHGYSIHEFSEGRKELPLEKIELEKINAIVDVTYNDSVMRQEEIDAPFLTAICRKGVSTWDALHLLQANNIAECEYFVTRDNALARTFKEKLASDLKNVKVVNRQAALKLL